MAKTVFIIYGRDSEAHDELVKFVRAVGLEELPFETVADGLGANPFIADIVTTGIEKADAVIALFTPDEQAILYDPHSGYSLADKDGGSRWQARPNVMFEAGVAFGRSGRQPILAVLGADVSLFSDVAGKHFIKLETLKAKRQLFNRLNALVGPLEPKAQDWETSVVSGDFAKCVRNRWPFFDETEDLQRYLANRHVGTRPSVTVLDIVKGVVLSEERDWRRLDARTFMKAVRAAYGETRADDAYWWMIVYGFFQFDNIDDWGTVDDATWDDSVDNARFAARGFALIDRIRVLAKTRQPQQALQPRNRSGRPMNLRKRTPLGSRLSARR